MPRESECTQEQVDKAREYVDGGYLEQGQVVPSSQGLALYLGVSRMTPYNWCTQKTSKYRDEMEAILDRLQATQAVRALNGGLDGSMNASVVKTVIGNHGYTEKQAVEHTGGGGGPIQWIVQPVKAKDADPSDT